MGEEGVWNDGKITLMAKLVPGVDYDDRVKSIRRAYVYGTPKQRLSKIRQRLNDQDFGPSRLVTIVSGVEAFARSLLINHLSKSKSDIEILYTQYKREGPEFLVEKYLEQLGQTNPSVFLKEDNWTLFKYAIEYRNMVVHECTFVGLDISPSLINACQEILDILGNLNQCRLP